MLSCSLLAGRDRGRFPSQRPAPRARGLRDESCSLPGCLSERDRAERHKTDVAVSMKRLSCVSLHCVFSILNSTSQVVISLCNRFTFLDALNNMKMKHDTHLMCVGLIVLLQIVKQLLQSLIFSDVSVRRMSGAAGVMIVAVAKDVLDEVLGLDAPAALMYGPAGLRRRA